MLWRVGLRQLKAVERVSRLDSESEWELSTVCAGLEVVEKLLANLRENVL